MNVIRGRIDEPGPNSILMKWECTECDLKDSSHVPEEMASFFVKAIGENASYDEEARVLEIRQPCNHCSPDEVLKQLPQGFSFQVTAPAGRDQILEMLKERMEAEAGQLRTRALDVKCAICGHEDTVELTDDEYEKLAASSHQVCDVCVKRMQGSEELMKLLKERTGLEVKMESMEVPRKAVPSPKKHHNTLHRLWGKDD